ncbi:outer membrane protein assembly factor BamE [Limnohabitans sp. Rim8]|uniref:outer membrane protein assembly factor BamE n=1 Tax=Limnohabitans sp. Rim8 TaxID=1100718 RepID=UPI0025E28154|nr:outer membrane protein assembly factor BamE [Limnohabitans sp. Rim8]
MTASLTFPATGARLAMLYMCAGLAGCGSIANFSQDTFKPYVPEVVQGNFVSKEQRQAIVAGMSRAQVKDILGTPLVTSLFHADRWDYTFSIRRQGVSPQSFQLTVFFKNDVVSSVDSGDLPSESEFVDRLRVQRKAAPATNLQASEEDLKKFPVNPAPTSPQPAASLPASYPPLEPAPR